MSLDQTVIENSNRAALVHHSLRVLVTHIGQEEAWHDCRGHRHSARGESTANGKNWLLFWLAELVAFF